MTSINVAFTNTSSFVFGTPSQQVTILDSTNPAYLRQVYLTQQGVKISRASAGIVVGIPLYTLFAAAGEAVPGITWPPIIVTQPTSSANVTHPATASLFISASDEPALYGSNDMTYQWYVQPSGSSTWSTPSNTGNVNYQGATTTNLSASFITSTIPYYYYECVVSNPSGNTTSSISKVNVS